MMDRKETLNLIPAYVLGALSDAECAEVEALLKTDSQARQLLQEYQEIAETLVFAAPAQAAPAHLQADLQQRLQASPPVGRGGTFTGRLRALLGDPRRLLPLAAAFLLVFTGLIYVLVGLKNAAPQSPEALYNELLADADSRTLTLAPHLNDLIYGYLVISSSSDQAVVCVWRLPELSEEEAFQLWLIDDNGSQSGGVFQFENPEGPNYIVVPLDRSIDAYQRFGVSIEPSTGSPLGNRPSGPRVFDVTLNAQQSG